MTSDKPNGLASPGLEDDLGQEWGEASLLDIERDLEELEGLNEMDVFGTGGEDLLADPDLELDEWEEYMDSHWLKLIE
ncbi:MAG: hypothetical protein HY787_00020 [Deltaproteobacteria bacterium]|nr:hypothetical protein [Deltaproteobacteria bacterium]